LREPAGTGGHILFRETRRRAAWSVSDWQSAELRWEARLGLDHWQDRGHHLSLGGAIEKRLAADRLALRAQAETWWQLGGGRRFASEGVYGSWRSRASAGPGPVWLARAALETTSETAPLALWPGAGGGHGRAGLLRAHPFLNDGLIGLGGLNGGNAIGPHLAHGGIEIQDWLESRWPVRWGVAVFVDVAKAWQASRAIDIAHADVGAGLRVELPGTNAGVLRLDAAHGLRDGAFALTIGWQVPWPTLALRPSSRGSALGAAGRNERSTQGGHPMPTGCVRVAITRV